MRTLIGLAVVLVSCATPAPATAASLHVRDGVLHYEAAPGEADHGKIFHDREYFWLRGWADSGDGCEPNEDQADYTWNHRCRAAGVTAAFVRLGDGRDVFSARSELPITLLGEEDGDELSSVLRGLVDGGPGDDTILVNVGGSATLAGGPGDDTVAYAPGGPFPDGVRVSLDGRPDDGPPGSAGNVMPDVENVSGGARRDVITGSAAANALSGGRNRDNISGRGGNDHIDAIDTEQYTGAHGPTVFYEERPDRVECGRGADTVEADPTDVVARDCERVTVGEWLEPEPGEYPYSTRRPRPVLTILNGSARDDHLIGTPGLANRILGRWGDDRISGGLSADALFGGAGSDTIRPGRGRDRVEAGGGADAVAARDGRRDMIACGSGRDRVLADELDRVARDCERVRRR